MLTCLIVDDELGAIAILRTFIERTPFLQLAGSTTNPLEALQLVQTQAVDLLFLDIQMPQLSGLEVMRLLDKPTNVILTTAYSEFAVEGFNLDALDYLLKPFAFERFLQAAKKAFILNQPYQLVPPAEAYIFVKTEVKGKFIKVEYDRIIFVEGRKNYVAIQTDREEIITLLNLKDLENKLPVGQFVRVHKSYLIALNRIQAIDSNQILLEGAKGYVPLGETYRPALFELLQAKLMSGRR